MTEKKNGAGGYRYRRLRVEEGGDGEGTGDRVLGIGKAEHHRLEGDGTHLVVACAGDDGGGVAGADPDGAAAPGLAGGLKVFEVAAEGLVAETLEEADGGGSIVADDAVDGLLAERIVFDAGLVGGLVAEFVDDGGAEAEHAGLSERGDHAPR